MRISEEMREQLQQLQTAPRTAEGCFDFSVLIQNSQGDDELDLALQIYPEYASIETTENKKEHYPDIIAQMRVWNARLQSETDFAGKVTILAVLYAVLGEMSPEIYEIYREMIDMLRTQIKAILQEFDPQGNASFAGCEEAAVAQLQQVIFGCCYQHFLLREKYEAYLG